VIVLLHNFIKLETAKDSSRIWDLENNGFISDLIAPDSVFQYSLIIPTYLIDFEIEMICLQCFL